MRRCSPPSLLVLSIPMYFLYRGTRVQAERQFQADAGYRPPPAS